MTRYPGAQTPRDDKVLDDGSTGDHIRELEDRVAELESAINRVKETGFASREFSLAFDALMELTEPSS